MHNRSSRAGQLRELKIHSVKLDTGGATVCQTVVPAERKTYSLERVTCKRCQHLDPHWQQWNQSRNA